MESRACRTRTIASFKNVLQYPVPVYDRVFIVAYDSYKGNAIYDTGVVIPYSRHRCPKQALFYDTVPCLRHTPRIPSELPRLFWHGEERSLKLSCAENGPVLDEIRRILVHLQNIQTGVVNNVIYDTGVANTLFTTPRNVDDTDPGSARRCHGCFGVV